MTYFCCKIFIFYSLPGFFFITFLSPKIATSINIHVTFCLSRIVRSGLLLRKRLSICNCPFHNMITLLLLLLLLSSSLSRYELDLVGVQEVRWDNGSTVRAGVNNFFYGKGNENHQVGTGFLYTTD